MALKGSSRCGGTLYIQSVLIIHGFPVYRSAYSLTFMCNPKVNACGAYACHFRVVKHSEPPNVCYPAEVKQGDVLKP